MNAKRARAAHPVWRWLIVATLMVGLMLGAGLWMVDHWLDQPVVQSEQVVLVKSGATLNSLAKQLQQEIGLQHPRWWVGWSRLRPEASQLKAGEYAVPAGITPRQLLILFSSGNVILRSITIVEGTTFGQLRRALAARDDVEQTLAQQSDADIMRSLNATSPPEGMFFPDTYRFARDTRDIELLRMAYQRMQRELASAWQARDPALPLSSPYEALIMASIVEKESALANERPIVAGVFYTRLNRNMRLQTDPTVIYGLGDRYDGNVRKVDLLTDTPYNTYTREGLPPTPICLPSAAALRAAVKPTITGAVYFVATGKGDGSHHFSRTLDEHNAALQRYLQTQRRRS